MRPLIPTVLAGACLLACQEPIPEETRRNFVWDQLRAIPAIAPGDSGLLDSAALDFDLSRPAEFRFQHSEYNQYGLNDGMWRNGYRSLSAALRGDSVEVRMEGMDGPPDALLRPPLAYGGGSDSLPADSGDAYAPRIYPSRPDAPFGLFRTRSGRKALVQGGRSRETRIYLEPYGLVYLYLDGTDDYRVWYREGRLLSWNGDTLDTRQVFGEIFGLLEEYERKHRRRPSFPY